MCGKAAGEERVASRFREGDMQGEVELCERCGLLATSAHTFEQRVEPFQIGLRSPYSGQADDCELDHLAGLDGLDRIDRLEQEPATVRLRSCHLLVPPIDTRAIYYLMKT